MPTNPMNLTTLSQDLSALGYSAALIEQPNGLPAVAITIDGLEYRAGQRWANRSKDRLAVWPVLSREERQELHYDETTPEATCAAHRGAKGVSQALKKVRKKWEPQHAEIRNRLNRRLDYETQSNLTRQTLLDALGPDARALRDDVVKYSDDGPLVKAQPQGEQVSLEVSNLTTPQAVELLTLLRRYHP